MRRAEGSVAVRQVAGMTEGQGRFTRAVVELESAGLIRLVVRDEASSGAEEEAGNCDGSMSRDKEPRGGSTFGEVMTKPPPEDGVKSIWRWPRAYRIQVWKRGGKSGLEVRICECHGGHLKLGISGNAVHQLACK